MKHPFSDVVIDGVLVAPFAAEAIIDAHAYSRSSRSRS